MSLIRFYIGKNASFFSCTKYMRFLKPITKFYKKRLAKVYTSKSVSLNEIKDLENQKLKKKVVALFLQYQPEASTMPKGGVFYNQRELVDFLCKRDDILLIVREHPNQYSTSYARQPETFRSADFYREDVIWHSHGETPFDLFAVADMVVSVGGTVLMEAALRGIPSVCLGKSFFSGLSSIIRINNYQELSRCLSGNKEDIRPKVEQFEKELNKLENYTIPAVIGGPVNLTQIGLNQEQNAINLQAAFECLFDEIAKSEII